MDWSASVGLQVSRFKHGQPSRHAHAICIYAIGGESGHQQAVFTRGLPQLAPYSTSSLSDCLHLFVSPSLVIVQILVYSISPGPCPLGTGVLLALGPRSDGLYRLAGPSIYSHSYQCRSGWLHDRCEETKVLLLWCSLWIDNVCH